MALDNLRSRTEVRTLWADAICINQADTSEREQQVQLMHKIYTNAQNVCSWIDHDLTPSLDVFDDLHKLGTDVEISDIQEIEHWYPVADILRNPYWQRLWVQQELILSKNLRIYCRHHEIDAQQLLLFQKKVKATSFRTLHPLSPQYRLSRYLEIVPRPGLSAHETLLETEEEQSAVAKELAEMGSSASKEQLEDAYSRYDTAGRTQSVMLARGVLRAKKALLQRLNGSAVEPTTEGTHPSSPFGSLMVLFNEGMTLKMSDPRDRLYGILGIATDVEVGDIQVDYSLPPFEVYCKVFNFFIQKYRSLDFLASALTLKPDHPTLEENYPSWFPVGNIDWGFVEGATASGSIGTTEARVDPSSRLLSVRGLRVDTISFVAARQPLPQYSIQELESKLEEYRKEIDPTGKLTTSKEDDNLYPLLFPRLSARRYRLLFQAAKPSVEEQRTLIQRVRDAANKAGVPNLTMRKIVAGGYEPHDLLTNEQRSLCQMVSFSLSSARFIGTTSGRIGTMKIEAQAKPGDQIWVVVGCSVPLILRPVPGEPGQYTSTGHANLPGFMDGEAASGLSTSADGALEPEAIAKLEAIKIR
jgi:hypothetical protein